MSMEFPPDIRRFPEQSTRVENGPIAFGSDWPGVFIRGDSAAFFATYLRAWLDGPPEVGSFRHMLALRVTEAVVNQLEACDLTKRAAARPSDE